MMKTAGIKHPTDLHKLEKQQLLAMLEINGQVLGQRHQAMLEALAVFINGGPAKSWKSFL
jgi:hypothetical protein